MKIESNRPGGLAGPAASPAKTAGGAAFTVQTSGTAAGAATVKAAASIIAASSVLALQGLDDGMQKRARHVRRGHDSLDALDQLKLGFLEGRAPGEVRATLSRLLKEREETGDPALDSIMDDIDVRVAVELAKLEKR